MTKRGRIRTASSLALAAALAAGGAAQEGEAYRFGEIIEVQLVNVEAWVTDSRGTPVKGLTAADFEVLEDGEPVEITHFAEIDGDEAVISSVERMIADDDPGQPPPPARPVDPGHLVIYFDQLHLKPASRNRLIKDLRDFLAAERVPPERVLILNQDFGLTTQATFGSDWQEIDAALERISKSAPLGTRVEIDKRLTIQRLQDRWKRAQELSGSGGRGGDACEFFLRGATEEIQLYANESLDRISITLDHLASTASFLTGVPGVKTLLYLSDSLERSPGSDLLTFINGLCPAQDQAPRFIISDELSRAFHQLTRHANANRVTIYSLQAHGLQASFTGSADQGALDQRGVRGLDSALRISERDGLLNLAAETGGRAILNRNQFDTELIDIAREMSSYYSIAYEPPHGGDQGVHRIEVRVKDSRFRVRHRSGYRDKSSDVRMTERLQGAVYLGLVENSLDVQLGAGAVRAGEKGRVVVPLHVIVPADKLAFLPEGDSTMAQLTVQVSTRNTKNQKGIFEQSMFRIRRPAGAEEELTSVLFELALPEGVHLIAVGVRDDATQETSFVTTTLELRAAAGEATG